MTEEKALTIAETMSLGMVFAQSGMFPDIKSQAQAVVKILAGRELGFGPIYAMTKVYIVKGRIMVAAEAFGAKIKASGRYDYSVKVLNDDECALVFTDSSKPVYESRFTMADARKADLMKPESGWMKWPRAMLMSKALSQGARIVCPHVIAGAYTPEDLEVAADAEGNLPADVVIDLGNAPEAPQDDTLRPSEEEEQPQPALVSPKPPETEAKGIPKMCPTHNVPVAVSKTSGLWGHTLAFEGRKVGCIAGMTDPDFEKSYQAQGFLSEQHLVDHLKMPVVDLIRAGWSREKVLAEACRLRDDRAS